MSFIPINLIRYLIVLKVNGPLAYLSLSPETELSRLLGEAIAERLPTTEARPWRKSMCAWEERPKNRKFKKTLLWSKEYVDPPEEPWPIDAAILFYRPSKKSLGQGEPIFLELKLMGDNADHIFFLEVILPALEELGRSIRKDRTYPNCLWGQFDIQSVYAARGNRWEPFVQEGRMDLDYRATLNQWSDGWTLNFNPDRTYDRITWITPFDLPSAGDFQGPILAQIIENFIHRISRIIFGKHYDIDAFWGMMSDEEQLSLLNALRLTQELLVLQTDMKNHHREWPGHWHGSMTLTGKVMGPVIPYLALASLFHVGRYTHYGCGTFLMN